MTDSKHISTWLDLRCKNFSLMQSLSRHCSDWSFKHYTSFSLSSYFFLKVLLTHKSRWSESRRAIYNLVTRFSLKNITPRHGPSLLSRDLFIRITCFRSRDCGSVTGQVWGSELFSLKATFTVHNRIISYGHVISYGCVDFCRYFAT